MFVGFIAVVVILMVIVGLMSVGALSGSNNSTFIAEAKKAHEMISNMNGEAKFYYVGASETFTGMDTDYFIRANFAPSHLVVSNPGMAMADWEGWPSIIDLGSKYDVNNDGILDSPYIGSYVRIGGIAGDDLRILSHSINNGNNVGFFLLKKKNSSVDPKFIKILEKEMSSDSEYIGG